MHTRQTRHLYDLDSGICHKLFNTSTNVSEQSRSSWFCKKFLIVNDKRDEFLMLTMFLLKIPEPNFLWHGKDDFSWDFHDQFRTRQWRGTISEEQQNQCSGVHFFHGRNSKVGYIFEICPSDITAQSTMVEMFWFRLAVSQNTIAWMLRFPSQPYIFFSFATSTRLLEIKKKCFLENHIIQQ